MWSAIVRSQKGTSLHNLRNLGHYAPKSIHGRVWGKIKIIKKRPYISRIWPLPLIRTNFWLRVWFMDANILATTKKNLRVAAF